MIPFFQSTIIEQFQIILDNKRNNIVFQALLEHNQSAYTTITILKRMDSFKLHMKVQNILEGLFFLSIVFRQQCFHPIANFFRKGGIHAANFIWQFLIITNSKPIFSGITGSILQNQVKFLDEFLGQRCFGVLNNHVDTTEMVRRFNHIIHIEDFIFYTNGICFKNISGLIVGQTAAFHVV